MYKNYFTLRRYMSDKDYVIWLIEKYGETIKEEVNVKELSLLTSTDWVSIQYIPLGNTLWAQFWKDTWRIIWSAKQWNASLQDDGTLMVTSWDESWILSSDQFEIRYSWFDQPNQLVEDGIMIELDLELTDELINEWIAREISRFLNQMRKDAWYDISDRVSCGYLSSEDLYVSLIAKHTEYLSQEALLRSLENEEIDYDYTAEFVLDEKKIQFYMKR